MQIASLEAPSLNCRDVSTKCSEDGRNRLPREVAESPSLDILKTRLDKVLYSL